MQPETSGLFWSWILSIASKVVSDLHEQNPYAKCAAAAEVSLQSEQAEQSPGKVWHMPFHQKVCLWRLVLALYKKGEVCAKLGPSFVLRSARFHHPM
jgi:hypothetical protein